MLDVLQQCIMGTPLVNKCGFLQLVFFYSSMHLFLYYFMCTTSQKFGHILFILTIFHI